MEVAPIELFDEEHGNPFEDRGYSYSVRRDGGRVVHVETRRDAEGELISQASVEVKYAIGSGAHARSYLFQRDGHMFFSPITWYSQKQTWDVSPAFRSRNHRFTLGISHGCVFCHGNGIQRDPHADTKFLPMGGAIGCERCHGPGQRHVQRQQEAESYEGQDFSIINPAKLSPVLRDAVCAQCHLEGELERFPRRGLDYFDFRPGLPLHLFLADFTETEKHGGETDFAGHVEQMRVSRCYLASEGKMGCISCHDPHKWPAAAVRATQFRNRCLDCHEERGCSKPLPERAAGEPGG